MSNKIFNLFFAGPFSPVFTLISSEDQVKDKKIAIHLSISARGSDLNSNPLKQFLCKIHHKQRNGASLYLHALILNSKNVIFIT